MLLTFYPNYPIRLRLGVHKGMEWNDHKGMEMKGIECI